MFDTPNPGWDHDDFMREMTADEEEAEYEVGEALLALGHEVRFVGVHHDLQALIDELAAFEPDLVFNGTESYGGEATLDYVVASVLEAEQYRYTGSPPKALLLTRDKALSKEVLAYHGVPVPGFVACAPGHPICVTPAMRFPLIVKPVAADASEGIAHASVVGTRTQLERRVRFVQETFGQPAIIEEFVAGRELYVSVIGNGDRLELLPLVELAFDKARNRPTERIATRSAKWDLPYRERRGIQNVFARPLADDVMHQIAVICRTAFPALHLRDYARLDVRVTEENRVWVIEANANPFISFGHDMANAAEKSGMDYYAFIERLIAEALSRYGDA